MSAFRVLAMFPAVLHTHPPAALAAWSLPCCLPLPGDALSLGRSPPRFLHGFPHPACAKVTFSEGLIFPLRPAVSSLPTPPPCPFSSGLGDVLLCVRAVTVSLAVCVTPATPRGGVGGGSVPRTKQVFRNSNNSTR